MTKSDTYFGPETEPEFRENLSAEVPEIKAHYTQYAVHNTNVSVTLTNTQTTVDVSTWVEPSDCVIKVYPVPRYGKRYYDDGVVTVSSTKWASGKITFAGYTTAIVSLTEGATLSFTASKFKAVKKLKFLPNPRYQYTAQVQFTDKAGVSHSLQVGCRPTDTPQIVDFAIFEIDRDAAMTVVLYWCATAATDGTEYNSVLASPSVSLKTLSPILIQVDMYNSIDKQDLLTKPYVSTSEQQAAEEVLRPFETFMSADAQVMSYPVQRWLSLLANAIAFSVKKGWTSYSDWDDLSEVRNLSKTLVGAFSAIMAGNLEDPLIPDHFARQIKSLLANNDPSAFEVAALWAVVDDTVLEVTP